MGSQSKFSEEFYIVKRKAKAFCRSMAYIVCRIFPMKKNKVVFWAFEGTRGYCCNPKYIADEMLRRQREGKAQFEMVWLTEQTDAEFPEEIRAVKSTLWNRAYHRSTAKVWVGNTRTFYGTRKRKGQTYIQTWHGTICIKPIGKYRGELFPKIAYLVSKRDSDLVDYVLSGCDWCDEHYRDGLIYDGEILRTGMPRCDILMDQGRRERIREQLREEYKVPEYAKVLMYAPTFRGGSQSTNRSVKTEEATIDFEQLIQNLELWFGGEWYIFLRLHPQLAAKKQRLLTGCVSERLVDVTARQDMNELIAASDAFISDYSSAIFEAMLLKIPCFLYADDLEAYIADRGDLFWDMNTLPFPLALNNQELQRSVAEFDEETYHEKLERFIVQNGVREDGHASQRVVDLIAGKCEQG